MIIRVSQKLKKTLDLSTGPVPKSTEVVLEEWTADLFHLGPEDLVIFVNSSTHMIIICSLEEQKQAPELFPLTKSKQLMDSFATRVFDQLIAFGVTKKLAREMMPLNEDIYFAKANHPPTMKELKEASLYLQGKTEALSGILAPELSKLGFEYNNLAQKRLFSHSPRQALKRLVEEQIPEKKQKFSYSSVQKMSKTILTVEQKVAQKCDVNQWKTLYDLADQVKQAAPWEHLYESEVFGVKEPLTGEIGYVSVMGSAGEHFSVSVYVGDKAFTAFEGLLLDGDNVDATDFFEIQQLQVSFEDREYIDPIELKRLKHLGLKYRGPNAWPTFKSVKPGCFPWHILSAVEADLLIVVLQQALKVFPKLKSRALSIDRDLLSDPILVRMQRKQKDSLVWQNRQHAIPDDFGPLHRGVLETELRLALLDLPSQEMVLEIDFFNMMMPLKEKGGRPYFAYMLIIAEVGSGFIVNQTILTPLPDFEKMWESIPSELYEMLLKSKINPELIVVDNPYLFEVLMSVEDTLAFEVELVAELEFMGEIKESIKRITEEH